MARALIQLFIMVSLCATARVGGAAVSVTAQLERSNVMAGETAILNVIVEGGRPESAETFPPIQGISVSYRGNSQNITSVNGITTVKHILNYIVSSTQPGQYTIPAISVTVNGTKYRTAPVVLTVTRADPSVQNQFAFLRLNVLRQEVYVGEVFPVELQLYVVAADDLQPPELKGDGFVVHEQVQQGRSQAQVGNYMYTVLTFKLSVSAAKAGKLTLGPAEMNLVLQIRQRADPNDLFGFFNRVQRRPATLASQSVEMNVLPLPTPTPPEFTGAIGKFDWQVTASPTNVTAGDPITLRISIRGRGNLDNLKLPPMNWPGFRAYQPASTSSKDKLGIEGVKTFEQVVIPQDPNISAIPPFSLVYFDSETRAYRELSQSAIPIQVTRGQTPVSQTALAVQTDASEDEPAVREDIVHIKSDPGPIVAVAPPLIQQPWFLLLQMIPVVGIIGVSVWRKRQDTLAKNPKLRRKLQVQRTVEAGLVELKQLAATHQAEAFYAQLFRLLQEQLGERLGLPASAITEAALDERLPRRGASPDLIGRLHALFQICNQARYAPVRTDAELLSLASDLEKALHDLQQLPD